MRGYSPMSLFGSLLFSGGRAPSQGRSSTGTRCPFSVMYSRAFQSCIARGCLSTTEIYIVIDWHTLSSRRTQAVASPIILQEAPRWIIESTGALPLSPSEALAQGRARQRHASTIGSE